IMALLAKSGSVSTLLNEQFIRSLTKQTKNDLTFNDLTALATNYLSATKHIKTTHLQGTSETINGQSMEVASKSELQRVTTYIREGLGLTYKKTGSIADMSATSTTTTSTDTTGNGGSTGDAGGSTGGPGGGY